MNAKEGRGTETNVEPEKEIEKVTKSVGSMSEQFVEEEEDSGLNQNLEEGIWGKYSPWYTLCIENDFLRAHTIY